MITFAKEMNIPLTDVPGYQPSANGHSDNIEKVWDYRDSDGKLLFQEVRFAGKKTRFRKPASNGWEWNIKDVKRVLYRFDELVHSATNKIYVVEGPKDVDTLTRIGLNATTSPMGAKSWKEEMAEPLKPFHVVIIPDNDQDGKLYAEAVAHSLWKKAPSIKIINLPDLPEHGDITDWINKGHTVSELNQLENETKEYIPKDAGKFDLYDTGLGLFNLDMDSFSHPWLIEKIWPDRCRGFIAGNPGVGKTWFALDMCISVATGSPFLNQYEVPKPGPCLLIEEETSRKPIAERLKMLVKPKLLQQEEIDSLSNLFVLTRKQIKIPQDQDLLMDFITRNNIKFVVFDSLRRFHSADENSSHQMQPILESFAKIGEICNTSVALIHHLHKSDEKSTKSIFEKLRGTSDFWAWRDAVVGIQSDGEGDNSLKISFQFRESESPQPFVVHRDLLSHDQMVHNAMSMDKTDKFQELVFKIKDTIRQNPDMFKTDILNKIKGRKQAKFQALEWMIKEEIVTLIGNKIYLKEAN